MAFRSPTLGTIAAARHDRRRRRAGTIAAAISSPITCAIASTISCSISCAHLSVAAAEVHPVRCAAFQIVVAEALRNVGVVVSHALAMRRIMLPAVSDVRGSVIDIDVAVAPVEAAAPIIAPASNGPAGAEGETCRNHSCADIGRIAEVIWRIVRIGPRSVDRGRIIIRHIDGFGIGLLDHNRLLAFLSLDADLLLLGGEKLLVVIGLGAQPLHRIHHVRLLGEHGIAEIFGPFELFAHHGEDVRGAGQRLDAVIPGLLLDLGLERVALERFVLL